MFDGWSTLGAAKSERVLTCNFNRYASAIVRHTEFVWRDDYPRPIVLKASIALGSFRTISVVIDKIDDRRNKSDITCEHVDEQLFRRHLVDDHFLIDFFFLCGTFGHSRLTQLVCVKASYICITTALARYGGTEFPICRNPCHFVG